MGYADAQGGSSMNTITVRLPEVIATQLEAERISQEDLNTFLIAAVEVWLMRRERPPKETRRPWSKAFQESAVGFVDQLIDENQPLFEELAQL
jgi:hypothetical protein